MRTKWRIRRAGCRAGMTAAGVALLAGLVVAGSQAPAAWGAAASNAAATRAGDWKILEPANTGIPGDYVYSIAVDAKGNPWMTADDPIWDEGGIGELKNSRWKQWTNVDGKSTDHFLRNLTFDAQGHAWASSPSGLLELVHGKVRTIWSKANAPWPTSSVRDFGWDSEGNLWVALWSVETGAGGVGRYANGHWKVWTTANGLPFGSPWNAVQSLAIDGQDRVWIGSPNRGAAVFNGKKWSLLGDPIGSFYDITVAPDGTPWFASDTSGVFSYEDGVMVNRTGDFGTGGISTVKVDRDGRIWIATFTGSIWRWSGTGSTWDVQLTPPSLGSHLYALDFDLDNRPVVGGIGGMAVEQSDGSWSPYTVESTGLSSRFISDVLITDDSDAWISTAAAGIATTNGKSWTNFNRFSPPWPFDTDSAAASAQTPDGAMWVAPTSHGVGRWDGSTWTSYLPGISIESMTVDSAGRVWVAPDRGQAMRFNGTKFVEMKNPPTGADLEDISADDEGNVWLAGGGLYKYDGQKWTTYQQGDGLPSDSITAVAAEPTGGVVWVGTDSGVARFDGTTSTNYTMADGLPADYVTTITVAPNGDVWMGAFQGPPYVGGVGHFDGTAWTSYTTATSPLPHNQIESIDVGPDGRVWIGTASEGVAIFTP